MSNTITYIGILDEYEDMGDEYRAVRFDCLLEEEFLATLDDTLKMEDTNPAIIELDIIPNGVVVIDYNSDYKIILTQNGIPAKLFETNYIDGEPDEVFVEVETYDGNKEDNI